MSASAQAATPQVSVVVPFLNEEATVEELVRRLRAVLDARQLSYELIFIDDGSTDATAARLRSAEAEDGHIRVFELTRNFGQNAALACGLFQSRGDIVVTMDSDLQNPPEEIPRLLDELDKGADVATGKREQRYESMARWLGSRGIHWVARQLTGADIEDFGGQFKAYRRRVVEEMRQMWAPGKPVFPLALWLGFPVAEIPVRHEARHTGGSRYTLRALLRINVDLITAFSTLPLALIGAAGLASFALGCIGIVYCLAATATSAFVQSASLTFFGVGAMLLATSVLGQYMGRIYRQVAGRSPGFVVRRGPNSAQ